MIGKPDTASENNSPLANQRILRPGTIVRELKPKGRRGAWFRELCRWALDGMRKSSAG
ncbi:MAG TPA: hypothetical protein VJX67_14530 [Blastocatellia bacterium]|nr:hypothetical protein [Blastocatellia bacterium]